MSNNLLKKFLARLILVFISLALSLLLLELGARVYIKVFPESQYKNHKDYRKSVPAPHKNSPYDVARFIDGTFGLVDWLTPEGTRLVIPKDFSSEYLNVRDGLRKTSHQPEKYEHMIYVFGASTVFCAEVPDDYTINSYLQQKINEKYPNKYKVENFGASSVVSAQELERLKTIDIKEGDIVIFFDGANDVVQSIYNNDPEGYIIGKNNQVLRESGKFKELAIKLFVKYGEKSKFVGYFLNPFESRFLPIHMTDASKVDQLTTDLLTNYLKNVTEAAGFTTGRKAQFAHFLQPNLYSGSYLTPYEFQLKNNYYLIGTGISEAFAKAYPSMVETTNKLKSQYNVNSTDLTNIFDAREKNEEFFLDWVHVTEKGNEIISNNIFKVLEENQVL
ncbi:hypothetical protein HYV31_03565 [candidate division WWE3 bacterium]|nr:hypothetical protein [candidate division WWE3 bacterium]